MARKVHDASICPSGAGAMHYRDECDEDSPYFTDPEPEVVESTCAWLVAKQEYDEENSKEGNVRERGLLTGWRDGSAASSDSGHERPDEKREADQQ